MTSHITQHGSTLVLSVDVLSALANTFKVDHLPSDDGNFDNWQENAFLYLIRNCEQFGMVSTLSCHDDVRNQVVSTEFLDLVRLHASWGEGFVRFRQELDKIRRAVQVKDVARSNYQYLLKQLIELYTGKTIHCGLRVTSGPLPTGSAKDSVALLPPKLELWILRDRRSHLLWFRPDPEDSAIKESSACAVTCEIAISTNGQQRSSLAGVVRSSPSLIEFQSSDVGTSAHYKARWINEYGEAGSWSKLRISGHVS